MTEVNSSDPDLPGVLSSLDEAAKRLNKISNNANTVLNSVEARLLRANLGLEVWWDESIMQVDGSPLFSDEEHAWGSLLLGFVKINDAWCLAVKQMRLATGYEEGEAYRSTQLVQGPIPLKSATRDVRLAALKALPRFLVHLTKAVNVAVEELETATKTLTAQGQ